MPKQNSRVSLADIAKALGISKVAVSLALRGSKSVSKSTAAKVRDKAAELGYQRDALLSRVMKNLKSHKSPNRFCETIALINANKNPNSTREHPTLPTYVEGIRRAADRMGYGIDEFWLHDPALDGDSLSRILKSRGIRGGIVVGLFDDNMLPEKFSALWKNFKFVATGLRTYNPTLDFTSADQFLIANRATLKIIEHGYTRPGLVLDKKIDELVEGRFAGGFLRAQLKLAEKDRISPFMETEEARENPEIFYSWLRSNKPDAILCLYNTPKKWLENIGMQVPRDIALVQLERRRSESDWTGMEQHNDLVGEEAVKKLYDLLNRQEDSAPHQTASTIVTPQWVEAQTMPARKSMKAPQRGGS